MKGKGSTTYRQQYTGLWVSKNCTPSGTELYKECADGTLWQREINTMVRAVVIGGRNDTEYVFTKDDETPTLAGYELFSVTGVNGHQDAHYLISEQYGGNFRDAMIDAINMRKAKLHALTVASTMSSLSEASVVVQEADRFRH